MGILTVSLNAAVDIVYTLHGFRVDQINKVQDVRRMAGGKANNVARVLASLGQQVTATGFAGGASGQFIQEDLRARGVRADFEGMEHSNRTCTTIIDQAGATLTEVREPGPTLTEADADRFLDRYVRLLTGAELVVISGSLPPGVPEDYYAELVSLAWRTGQVRALVDASGAALRNVLRAQPYLVKPNLEELEEWAGRPLPDDEAVLAAASDLMDAGPLTVAVSMGARGLLLVSPEGVWRAAPPKVQPVNTVGSGDSLVAGLATGLLQGLSANEILRLAVACGTANVLTTDVASVRTEDLTRIKPQVRVGKIT